MLKAQEGGGEAGGVDWEVSCGAPGGILRLRFGVGFDHYGSTNDELNPGVVVSDL